VATLVDASMTVGLQLKLCAFWIAVFEGGMQFKDHNGWSSRSRSKV